MPHKVIFANEKNIPQIKVSLKKIVFPVKLMWFRDQFVFDELDGESKRLSLFSLVLSFELKYYEVLKLSFNI